MKGRGLISLFLSLVSINFVSAAIYGNFSLESLLNSLDPSTMVLGVIFIISSLLINTALKRVGVFRDSQSVAGVISISLALLIIWGVNRSGMDYYGLFNGILFFVPVGFLELVWPIVFLLGMGLLFWKFKKHALLFLGIMLIAGSFFAYESGILQVIGGILIFIWLLLLWMGRKKKYKDPYLKPSRSSDFRMDWENAIPNLSHLKGNGRLGKKALGLAGKSLGYAGKKIKSGAGWAGNKYKQRQYNKSHDAALKENRERDHEAALRENAARDKTKAQKQIEYKQVQEQRSQQKAEQQAAKVQSQQQRIAQREQKQITMDLKSWMSRAAKIEGMIAKWGNKRPPNDPKILKLNRELERAHNEIKKLRSEK